MANMSLKKVKMPEQEPELRKGNFLEVALGYTPEMAMEEAERCLQCKDRPCVSGCPVQVQIPDFLKLTAEGRFTEACEKIRETSSLPAVCGRVCPQEGQCEKYCVRGKKGDPVAIGRLERFVGDWYLENAPGEAPLPLKTGKKAAVIGSGPAGLACAADLARLGHSVVIFEAFHVAGGVLMYGIPEFRLPKAVVRKEIDRVTRLGVEIQTNMVIGKVLSLEELAKEGFEAVFIGSGAGLPSFLDIPGENLNGVYSANEFLTRVNLMKAYRFPDADTPVKVGKNVAVVGGGNVAMDAARCAKRLGADTVRIIYRRSAEEMPARLEEVLHAQEEGILFQYLTHPVRILGTEDGWVNGLECVRMDLGVPDASGRRRPVAVEDSEHLLEVETVIVAIGQKPNPLLTATVPDLKTHPWGGLVVEEETGATSEKGVFAGGDAVTGAATVILAMGAGKKAARAMDAYLRMRQEESKQ